MKNATVLISVMEETEDTRTRKSSLLTVIVRGNLH